MWENDIEAAPYVSIRTLNKIDEKTGMTTTTQVKEHLFPTEESLTDDSRGIGRGEVEQTDDFGFDIPMSEEGPAAEPKPRKVRRYILSC